MSEPVEPGAAPPDDSGWGADPAGDRATGGGFSDGDEGGRGAGGSVRRADGDDRAGPAADLTKRGGGRVPAAPGEAARAYQAVIADLTAAAGDLRERDLARAAELAGGVAARDEAMGAAGLRTALTDMVVTLHWEAALESLWDEQWMTLRPRPTPITADAERLAELEAAVEQRAADLQDAVRHRWYRPTR